MVPRRGVMSFILALQASGAMAGTQDGSCLEAWELLNYQAKSATYNQLVKSSSYRDLPTVAMLLSSG